jgi:two-component system chemotaxis response regulator CheB
MNLAVVDDEPLIRELAAEMLRDEGHKVQEFANANDAQKAIENEVFDVVFCDIQMHPRTGTQLLEALQKSGRPVPPFVFVTGHADHEAIERANRISKVDVVMKPFAAKDLINGLTMFSKRMTDPIFDIMEVIRQVSGMALGDEKRGLAETRIYRRARQLGLADVDAYLDYFKKNRDQELSELVSHMTTHHTYLLREPEHFEFLEKTVFPKAFTLNKPLRIWSAASSTGEEAYSIAMTWFEFLRKQGISPDKGPKIEIVGSDIDEKSVQTAANGVYNRSFLDGVSPEFTKRYFDFGSGDLSNMVRAKDFIHKSCSFRRHNLLHSAQLVDQYDCIFMRNVLIYFKPNDVESIVNRALPALKDDGYFIIGHSESLHNLQTGLVSTGHSIYSRKQLQKPATSQAVTNNVVRSSLAERGKVTRVFIVDDSATVRAMLKKIFSSEHGFEVAGEAASGAGTFERIKIAKPDVVTLDIHMPDIDGIAYLKSVHGKDHPPIVMVSSVSESDAKSAMMCFELGAADYFEKPSADLMDRANDLRQVVRGVTKPNSRPISASPSKELANASSAIQYNLRSSDLICIGSSTGGVDALRIVLTQFPENCPPTIVVQHIPAMFSKAMADRLSQLCKPKIKEAANGDPLEPGHVYVAPGGKQMALRKQGSKYYLEINDDPPMNRHRPSVDYTFQTVRDIGKDFNVSAAILTGMGADGAKGLLGLKQMNAHTVAQDEESCVVFGMPKVAIEMGAALEVLPLPSVAYHLFKGLNKKKNAA